MHAELTAQQWNQIVSQAMSGATMEAAQLRISNAELSVRLQAALAEIEELKGGTNVPGDEPDQVPAKHAATQE